MISGNAQSHYLIYNDGHGQMHHFRRVLSVIKIPLA